MLQAYRFRIYPTDEQREAIERNFGCARYVYNHYLEKRRYLYEKDGKKMSRFDCMRDLTLHKQEEPWLKEADSAALKYAITHLDFAYQNFFRRVKRGENPGYPRFKSKKDRHQSYKTFPRIKGEQSVFLPKIGNVECRISRPVEGRIVSGTVSRTPSDRYFVSLTCECPEKEKLPLTGENIGLSNSAKGILAASSLGDLFMSCNTLEENLDRIARMQRRMQQKRRAANGMKRRASSWQSCTSTLPISVWTRCTSYRRISFADTMSSACRKCRLPKRYKA